MRKKIAAYGATGLLALGVANLIGWVVAEIRYERTTHAARELERRIVTLPTEIVRVPPGEDPETHLRTLGTDLRNDTLRRDFVRMNCRTLGHEEWCDLPSPTQSPPGFLSWFLADDDAEVPDPDLDGSMYRVRVLR